MDEKNNGEKNRQRDQCSDDFKSCIGSYHVQGYLQSVKRTIFHQSGEIENATNKLSF